MKYPKKNKNGEHIQVHSSVSLIKGSNGQRIGVVSSNRDITQRKLAEKVLIESEQRFERIVNATNDAIYDWCFETNSVWRNDGSSLMFGYNTNEIIGDSNWWEERIHPDDRERIVTSIHHFINSNKNQWVGEYLFAKADGTIEASSTWGAFTGQTNEQWRREGWLELLHPEDKHRVVKEWQAVIKEDVLFTTEYRVKDINREWRWHIVRAVPLRNDKIYGWVGMNIDITEQKQAEFDIQRLNNELEQRVIERTTQLELANKELEAFSYSVSHDLRAPLRHITGYANIVQEDHGDKLDTAGNEVLDIIINSALKMRNLIDDLLEFSRMGRKGMEKTTVNMHEMAKDVSDELLAQEKDRVIHLKLGPLKIAEADYQMIRQVWVNLISNAIRYRDTHKTLSFIDIEVNVSKTMSITIKDNGIGIDNKNLSKIFEMFYRGSEISEGAGLGLYIAKEAVAKLNGKIVLESICGKGTKFVIIIPNRVSEPQELST